MNVPVPRIQQLVGKDGLINLLTVIPPDEIVTKGIPYIREKFDESNINVQMNEFWRYFIKTWTESYEPKV